EWGWKCLGTTNGGGLVFGGGGFGEDHDKISTDRSSGGLVGGRNDDGHGSKWPSHWRLSTSAVEPKSLWPLRLSSSLLRLLSQLLRLLSQLLRLLSQLPHRGWLLGLLPHRLAGAR